MVKGLWSKAWLLAPPIGSKNLYKCLFITIRLTLLRSDITDSQIYGTRLPFSKTLKESGPYVFFCSKIRETSRSQPNHKEEFVSEVRRNLDNASREYSQRIKP
ncbi:hypothetical protein AVEN_123862-1 [Araneus ventricosus]|uniref:Uncharacterized protein n=1 Tax=Araneus ventricosus TaxID=182803 RepID=A0A4Y2GE93_ARAVE|nr:hypothetical protein AVEN_123862-1 [Araneus ventricosus]